MKNQPKKEKRPTEDEVKKKFKTAVDELVNVIKKFVELNVPTNMVISLVYHMYVAQKLISTLDTLKNELERK